jgi:hypothetical protein
LSGGSTTPNWPPAEVIAWRSSIEDKLLSLRDVIDTRLDGMDKAAEVLSDNVNRFPTLLDREAGRLQALFNEKTNNILDKIREHDDQAKQDKATSLENVKTALNALKELIALQNSSNATAIAKSEAATSNELAALERAISQSKEALSADITNLKQRMDRSEGANTGHREAVGDTHSNVGSVTLMVGCIVGFVGMLLTGYGLVAQHNSTINPTIGADTKRVDDLIAINNQRAAELNARLDALSARLNGLPLPPVTPTAPQR